MALKLVVERLARNAQGFQRGFDIAMVDGQRVADQLRLEAFHPFRQAARTGRLRRRQRRAAMHAQHDALGEVGQLAHVAGPGVFQQMLPDLRRQVGMSRWKRREAMPR